MMDIGQSIETYERDLKARGLSLNYVLERAGVDRSTWTRWKGIPSKEPQLPSLSKWQAVEREMNKVLTPDMEVAE